MGGRVCRLTASGWLLTPVFKATTASWLYTPLYSAITQLAALR